MKFSLIAVLVATLGSGMPHGVSGQDMLVTPYVFPSQMTWAQVHAKDAGSKIRDFCNEKLPDGALFCDFASWGDYRDTHQENLPTLENNPTFEDDLSKKLGYPNYDSIPSKPIGLLDGKDRSHTNTGEMYVLLKGNLTMLQYDQYPDVHDVPLEVLCGCWSDETEGPLKLPQRTPFPTYAPPTPAPTNPPTKAPVPMAAPEPVPMAALEPVPMAAPEPVPKSEPEHVPAPAAAAQPATPNGTQGSGGANTRANTKPNTKPQRKPGYHAHRKPTSTKKGPVGSASGDPHFKTFGGGKFDFHGGCDLVLLDSPRFRNSGGLTIHIRTKIETSWSYIESGALKIGEDTLEVTGGEQDSGRAWVNGNPQDLEDGNEVIVGGFPVVYHKVGPLQSRYRIDFDKGDAMSVETFKSFVRINIRAQNLDNFKGALGLMGSYPSGAMMGRDGVSVIGDPNAFGQEWQVQASEPMLFHETAGVQHPQECAMPDVSTKNKQRRLGESFITQEDAETACQHVEEEERDACVFDVLATNDKDMAGAY